MVGLHDLLREREDHGKDVCRHRLGVAAGLVDDEHARLGAILDIDGVETGAVGGDDKQVGHARQQFASGIEARIELVA